LQNNRVYSLLVRGGEWVISPSAFGSVVLVASNKGKRTAAKQGDLAVGVSADQAKLCRYINMS